MGIYSRQSMGYLFKKMTLSKGYSFRTLFMEFSFRTLYMGHLFRALFMGHPFGICSDHFLWGTFWNTWWGIHLGYCLWGIHLEHCIWGSFQNTVDRHLFRMLFMGFHLKCCLAGICLECCLWGFHLDCCFTFHEWIPGNPSVKERKKEKQWETASDIKFSLIFIFDLW